MSAAPAIAVATGTQVADAGALTAEAYLADRLVDADEDYTSELRDAERRAAEATLLVATVEATDGSPVVVGTITLAPHGTSYAEVAEPGELELRMLAVAPEARGRGIAEALMRAAVRQCVVAGARRIVLSTLDAMTTAQRLYGRLGFEAQPQRDWGHVEIHLRVYTWTPPDAPGALIESATWPPARVEVTPGGWRVGLSGGVTRRANSAVPGSDTSAAAIDEIEAIYAGAGLPSIVRVRASDERVEAQLADRGYAIASDTDVLVRDLGPGTPEPSRPHLQVRSATTPDDAWLTAWLGVKKAGADRALARQVLVGAPADYLTAIVDGRVAGVIRVAFAEDWAGLSSLAVEPSLRRAGLGRELTLRALAAARNRGARRVFLQVEAHNAGAARLYAGLGFQPADAYRYRELAAAEDGPPTPGC
ncbi:GNAT family N-acetyltransferase [Cellulomonas sp. PhB150]|uniref:GNAT family N-acetyltransferase n=1 Tax=Cellulomonas sp. PhB150 TaxID=2485188 RepID=UPI000F4A30CC|nr:GNAT family N-acetyltransferase [Cellulomonas sp. PhB150]ROS27723.1 acetyltransferase (GNAT) family protein [Cellulomonas sp. PhB150]